MTTSAHSILKRATIWFAVTVAAVATATVVAASPSFATSYIITETSAGHGWASFNERTALLTIKDTNADGYGIAVKNFRSDVGNDQVMYIGWDRNGNGNYAYYQLHMPVGATISFHVCAEDDGLILSSTCGARGFGTYSPII